MRRWRIPSGGFLVESPERVTAVPRGPLLEARYLELDGDLRPQRTFESSRFGLEDDLYETDYEVRGDQLVRIERVWPKRGPDVVRVILSGLVEVPSDGPALT